MKKILLYVCVIILIWGTVSHPVEAAMRSGAIWNTRTLYYRFLISDSTIMSYTNTAVSGWNNGLELQLIRSYSNYTGTGVAIDAASHPEVSWDGLCQLTYYGGFVNGAYIIFNTYLLYRYMNNGVWVDHSSARSLSTVYHELGHALGLDEETNSSDSVMIHNTLLRKLTPTERDKNFVNAAY